MANIHPDITPRGLSQKDRVNMHYMLVSSLTGICAKLDVDGGVTDTTYEANCITALFNTKIDDTRGNSTGVANSSNTDNFRKITPTGVTDDAELELYYQIYDAIETLTEQLDADGTVTDTDYEANVYTALCLKMIRNKAGNDLGNGNEFWFNPGGGMRPQREFVDLLYDLVNAVETLTEQLDADGGVTDTTYESLWFTANILLRVENSAGNVVGNTSTHLG